MMTQLIHSILTTYKNELGNSFEKYYNHACRVYNYAAQLSNATPEEQQQLAIAAAFHDIGIWTANTFDYLNPSAKLADEYLAINNLQHWSNIVTEIIDNHHKLTPYKKNNVAESFRRADLADLTWGFLKSGVSAELITSCKKQYPANGFHAFIFKAMMKNIVTHPLNPLPIVKW